MIKNDFLYCLKAFTEEAVKDLLLPVRAQRAGEEDTLSPASVYLMRLPDSTVYQKKTPYIIHQVVESEDGQRDGHLTESVLTVRTIFCVYNKDGQEGALQLNELVDRLRVSLLRTRILENRYFLDVTESDMKFIYFTEDIFPYYAGELETVWRGESVQMDVDNILTGGPYTSTRRWS